MSTSQNTINTWILSDSYSPLKIMHIMLRLAIETQTRPHQRENIRDLYQKLSGFSRQIVLSYNSRSLNNAATFSTPFPKMHYRKGESPQLRSTLFCMQASFDKNSKTQLTAP
ncbi:Hypothetical_protein [Hexamita inflata]|uniref:Hypothetical_protein n=1 Tax=Hexamita inflata TaxID=28002 RepID=A0ABP1GH65_9EUKA